MVRVQFKRFSEPDQAATWIDAATRAVPAAPFAETDSGEGGITRADIGDEALIVAIERLPAGAEIYAESEDADDCLDNTDDETERSTHIWWRATILPAPAASSPKYTLDGEPVDLDEFIADNAETFTEGDVAAVRALKVGEEIAYGGGGQAVSVLRRVE